MCGGVAVFLGDLGHGDHLIGYRAALCHGDGPARDAVFPPREASLGLGTEILGIRKSGEAEVCRPRRCSTSCSRTSPPSDETGYHRSQPSPSGVGRLAHGRNEGYRRS